MEGVASLFGADDDRVLSLFKRLTNELTSIARAWPTGAESRPPSPRSLARALSSQRSSSPPSHTSTGTGSDTTRGCTPSS